MKGKISISILCICLVLLSSILLGVQQSEAAIVLKDANNKTCPVTGSPITKKRFNSGYDGKRYWFSSFDAVLAFDKDPEKYLSKTQPKIITKPAKPATKVYKRRDKKKWYQR